MMDHTSASCNIKNEASKNQYLISILWGEIFSPPKLELNLNGNLILIEQQLMHIYLNKTNLLDARDKIYPKLFSIT